MVVIWIADLPPGGTRSVPAATSLGVHGAGGVKPLILGDLALTLW
jgi:hypothetical protein